MLKNVIDYEMSTENEEAVVTKIKEIEALFPFCVDLSPRERKQLSKMGRKGLDFVERSMMYAREYPILAGGLMDVDALQRDLVLYKQLQRVLSLLNPLAEKLRTTYLLLGAEAYAGARTFYRSAKNAVDSGLEGTSAIVKDLSYHYKKSLPRSQENNEDSTTTVTVPQDASQAKLAA